MCLLSTDRGRTSNRTLEQTEFVRKQYHFWPGEAGLDAWDVDRLISLSRDLQPEYVAVDAIDEIDSVYWFDGDNRPTVRAVVEHVKLMNEVDFAHPIILSAEGRVMDGMHRVARALLEGRKTVVAVRFTHPIPPDYRNIRPGDLPY
jgi:hypothetical protein